MRRLLATFVLAFGASNTFAATYNNISIQGQLISSAPVYDVDVNILSEGQEYPGTRVALLPDESGFFSTQTYITAPKVFLAGTEYIMRLSTGTSPINVISSFTLTAVPFAQAVRGDQPTGDENVFGAYGNVGIGTTAPAYRLVVSSAGSDLFWVASDGVYASTTVAMQAGSYKIKGATVLGIDMGDGWLGDTFVGAYANAYAPSRGLDNTYVGMAAGLYTTGDSNTFLGYNAGARTGSGSSNTFLGSDSGFSNTSGSNNIFLGPLAGDYNTSGSNNILIGYRAGMNLTTGSNNIFIVHDYHSSSGVANELNIGNLIFGDLATKTIGIGVHTAQAALDVVSTGTASNQYAQIWRDGAGIIKSSMSATGIMMAAKFIGDGSGLTGLSGGADNLGNHTATQNLNMSGFNINAAGAISANSQVTTYSTMTVAGSAFSVGGSTLVVANGRVGISSAAPVAQLGVEGNAVISGTLTVQALMPDNFIGAIMYFARNSCPNGFLKANGTAVSRATYAKLFDAINVTFGPGDGSTTFNLPDMRGEFVRGYDDGRGVDTPRSFGSWQNFALQGHKHAMAGTNYVYFAGGATTYAGGNHPFNQTTTFPGVTSDTAYGAAQVASETRPRNIALLGCIKF